MQADGPADATALREERGVGGIIVTHDARMARHADRTIEIVDGRLAPERQLAG